MGTNGPELYTLLAPESQQIVDNVAAAFINSLINILEHNFKQNNRIHYHSTSASGYTSSQKLATTFANRWFTGLINELIKHLFNIERNTQLNRKFSSTGFLDTVIDSNLDNESNNYTCPVPNIQFDSENNIHVTYSNETDTQTAEMTAQDFGHLLCMGLKHQMAVQNILKQFWSICGSLVLKSVAKLNHLTDESASTAKENDHNANGNFENLIFSKTWYQVIDELLGVVPIRVSEAPEGMVGLDQLQDMTEKLEFELKETIEQAKVLSKIKSLIDERNTH